MNGWTEVGERTPLRRLTDTEEGALLEDLLLRFSEATILTASDLHLGPGRRRSTQTFYAEENFFADEAFARWLDCHQRHFSRLLLVLIGDVFDFTRLDHQPETADEFRIWSDRLRRLGVQQEPEGLKASIVGREQKYGLRTQDYKSVWKLWRMADGHVPMVRALAQFVSAGGGVVVIKGNHDLEMHWPLVRLAIRDELVLRGARPEEAERNVAFAEEGVTIRNVYFEHGHQYEAMTRVEGVPALEGGQELRLPLGSFVNRYIINPIERLDPFIDNIKPVQQAVATLLRRYPVKMLSIYFRAWTFVLRALKAGRYANSPVLVTMVGLLAPPLSLLGAVALAMGRFRLPTVAAAALSGPGFTFLLPYAVGLTQHVLRSLGLLKPANDVAEGARRSMARVFHPDTGFARVYAVMGHTHRQDVRRFATTPREEFYVNTGTWIPLWPQERRDLVGRVIYSFARFEWDAQRGEFRHEACEWDDHAGESRPARILVPASEDAERASGRQR